jgi:hypothetical protein
LGANLILKKRSIFEACTLGGKKTTCIKRRKSNMQEEKQRGMHANKPNHVRVRVFGKYCNDYKPIG